MLIRLSKLGAKLRGHIPFAKKRFDVLRDGTLRVIFITRKREVHRFIPIGHWRWEAPVAATA